MGISIALSAGTFVSFALFVAEQDGKAVAKVGAAGKILTIDFSSPGSCNELYEDIVTRAKTCFDERRKPEQKSIGFAVQLPND